MPPSRPRYLLHPLGAAAQPELAGLVGAREVWGLDALIPDPADVPHGETPGVIEVLEPGWVFLPPQVEGGFRDALLRRVAMSSVEWAPLFLLQSEEGLLVLPALVGFPLPLQQALPTLELPGTGPALLSFRLGVRELARIRHDINNPLTAALAETQLLLMDVTGEEEVEALRVIEHQLRRIRDLTAELAAFRVPKG